MLDAALIKQCADPSLKPAIVEQFIEAVGATDPLAVTVTSGGRLVLLPKAKSQEQAMEIIRQNVGQAVVRVGLTQFPAGVGVKDVSELTSDLVNPCENLAMGTRMFAKILRIVAKWYGNPNRDEVFPQIFEDAIYAWKTGRFEGENVFQAQDPGGPIKHQKEQNRRTDDATSDVKPPPETEHDILGSKDIDAADMRIDLSRIGGN
jgi:hypothetical protein